MHWRQVLRGSQEGNRWNWRAPCPVCQSKRSLHWEIKGKSIWWNSFCEHHDKDALRPVVLGLVGKCMPGRHEKSRYVERCDLEALALSGMPPMSLKLALLEMAGWSTKAALDKLGVRRENRSRVITRRRLP